MEDEQLLADRREQRIAEEEAFDRRLGLLIRYLRWTVRMTAEELAGLTGIPADELRDHEAGALSVPASRTCLLLDVLSRRLEETESPGC